MNEQEKTRKILLYQYQALKSSIVYLVFLLTGWGYGFFNELSKQVLYWVTFIFGWICCLTFFGLIIGVPILIAYFIWWIYILFNLSKWISGYNYRVALKLDLDEQTISELGLSKVEVDDGRQSNWFKPN